MVLPRKIPAWQDAERAGRKAGEVCGPSSEGIYRVPRIASMRFRMAS